MEVLNSEEQKANLEEKVEDKFKFAILQVDKRLVNLEIAIGEINEKLKSLQTIDIQTIHEIKERLDELEDLIMVENLGGVELKKLLETLESRTTETSQRTIALSKEIKNFEAILPQIEQIKNLEEEIKKLASKIGLFESSIIKKIEEEIVEIKDKNAQLALKEDLKKVEKEIERINEKIAGILLPTEQILELGDKILALEEKMRLLEGLKEDFAPIKTEIIKLREKTKFLESSIPGEKVGRIEEEFLELKEKVSQAMFRIEELSSRPEIPEIVEKRVSKLEEKVSTLSTETMKSLKEVIKPEFEEKINFMSNEVKKLEEEIEIVKSKIENLPIPIKEVGMLEEKVNELENRAEEITKLKGEFEPEIVKLKEELKEMEEKIKSIFSKLSEINQLKEKTEKIEPSLLKKVEENISGLRDKLNEIENRTKQIEEISKSLISIEEKMIELREKIRLTESSVNKNVDEKISVLPLLSEQVLSLSEAFSKVKEEIDEFKSRTEQIVGLQNEVKRLNERIKPLETQVIQRVASEISDLRAETSKEIKDIKDKISGIIATKSEIDIKFLSSRLNSLKENVDYLLNRKAEFDMKIDNLQKALTKLIEKVDEIASRPEIPSSVEEKLARMESRIEAMPNEIFENLKAALSQLPGKSKIEKKEMSKPSDVDHTVKELLKKISSLESKLVSLEEEAKGSNKPLVVE
ncbi:MAG: hypothetical protein QXL86_01510 [Candidatus Aenigmatarchaeota archaeon]